LPASDGYPLGISAVDGGVAVGLETGHDVSNPSFFTGKSGVLSKLIAHRPDFGEVTLIFINLIQL
jgi:hypothetical protein